jgi:hypothetical protein
MDPLALQDSQVPSDDGGLAVEVEDAVGDGSVVLPEVEAVEDAVEDAVGQPVVEPDSQPDHDDDEGIAIVDLVESQGPGPDDGDSSDGQELCVGICHCDSFVVPGRASPYGASDDTPPTTDDTPSTSMPAVRPRPVFKRITDPYFHKRITRKLI